MTTIGLTNPWTGSRVETEIDGILSNGLDAYSWPEDLCDELSATYDTDEDWLRAAVAALGEDEAGRIIIGS